MEGWDHCNWPYNATAALLVRLQVTPPILSKLWHLTIFAACIVGVFWLVGCISTRNGPPSPSAPFSSPDAKHWPQSPTVAIPAQSAPFLPPATNHPVMVEVPRAMADAIMFNPAVVQHPPARLPIGWDEPTNGSLVDHWNIYTGYGPGRWLKTNVLYASNAVWEGQTVRIILTNFYWPMVVQVEACNAIEVSNAPSLPFYYRFNTNGTVAQIQGELVAAFVADSNTVYSLSNAPLASNRWVGLAIVSNRSGLVSIPLSNQTGRILIQASR